MITGKGWDGTYKLVHASTGAPVELGERVHSRTWYKISGGQAPHKLGSTGRVHVTVDGAEMGGETSLFPTVFDLKWEKM